MFSSFLVPYRADGGWRDTLWVHVRDRLRERIDSTAIEVVVSTDGGDDPGMFNHPRAINLCARDAGGDVLIIYDADTTFDDEGPLLDAIVETYSDRRWRLPQRYVQLTEEATRRRLSGEAYGETPVADISWVGDQVSWSGIVVVPREAFYLVGGYDERYEGWGADDIAFGLSLETLYGPHLRYPGEAIHLWHPRGIQERGLHANGNDGRNLTRRYIRAAGNRVKMRALIVEKKEYCGAPRS